MRGMTLGETEAAVLDVLEHSAEPLTTAEIKQHLRRSTSGGDIYGVLFLLQSAGLIACTFTAPWRWARAGLSSAGACEGGVQSAH